jgi:hypothetical protein
MYTQRNVPGLHRTEGGCFNLSVGKSVNFAAVGNLILFKAAVSTRRGVNHSHCNVEAGISGNTDVDS